MLSFKVCMQVMLLIYNLILRNLNFSLNLRKESLLFIIWPMEVLEIGLEVSYILLDSRLMKPSKTSYRRSVLLGSILHITKLCWCLRRFHSPFCIWSNISPHALLQFGSYLWGWACDQPFSLYTKRLATYTRLHWWAFYIGDIVGILPWKTHCHSFALHMLVSWLIGIMQEHLVQGKVEQR